MIRLKGPKGKIPYYLLSKTIVGNGSESNMIFEFLRWKVINLSPLYDIQYIPVYQCICIPQLFCADKIPCILLVVCSCSHAYVVP